MAEKKPDEAPAAQAAEEEPQGQDPTLSRDAQHSTYAAAPEDPDAGFPPPGPAVEQTLGKPS